MKNYPRIRRLSTLGIIRHQHFDYEFGPFRTDFVGEGGAGKSMIADMLQLIFVGVRYFHSPTESYGPREAKTLVLRTEGKGTDMGYAFLTIELGKHQYVIVGIYLESSGAAQMFIVQAQENFEPDIKLVPFTQLLGVEEFQRNNTILPINELRDHISDNFNLFCESWERTQFYHKILFYNDILPLDLSVSNQALHNYAKIIQTFSRKSLDIDASSSLQSFLFGDEIEKEFMRRFETTVEELRGDEKQFIDNLNEIDKLTIKQQKLSDLLDLKLQKELAFTDYIKAAYDFYDQQQDVLLSQLEQLIIKYDESTKLLPLLKEELSTKLDVIAERKPIIEKQVEEALILANEWNNKHKNRETFLNWLTEFGVTAKQLIAKYDSYQESKDGIRRVNELEKLIKDNNISGNLLLDLSGKGVLVQIQQNCEKLKEELEFKNKLHALNNIDEPTSIARWALESNSFFDLKQEGIIRKYQNQDVRVDEPNNSLSRFIPDPDVLLKGEIPVYKEEEDGFWLNLNGVLEFISTDFKSVFNTGNKLDIKKYFESQTTSIISDIKALDKELAEYTILYKIFEHFTDPDEYLKAWNSKWDLELQLQSHELFSLKREEVLYYHDLSLDHEIPQKKIDFTNSYKVLKNQENELISLYTNLHNLEGSFIEAVYNNDIQEIVGRWKYDLTESLSVSDIVTNFHDNEFYGQFLKIYDDQKQNYLAFSRIKEIDKLAVEANANRNEAYGKSPDIFNSSYVSQKRVLEEVERLHEESLNAENKYIVKYNIIAGENLSNNVKRFEDSGDFQGLCSEILPPEILSDSNILEKDVIEKIRKYLADINLKNKKLNSRKLNKLAAIIDDVWLEVSNQLNMARYVRNFLNDDEKIISGGHKATLSETRDNSLSPEWMQIFVDNIKEDAELGSDYTLFAEEKGISNELEKYHSLTEKLQQAYYRSGGDHNLKPKIKELLNPKSYYGLKFSMVNSSGKKNDGSTSQTYSAIALLCMAKLSLLEVQQSIQECNSVYGN
ncbi:DNA repair protein Rad50 [Chryseobacterium sp. PET-29]|uniref:DNA repair protein Rad50 n=1 Tax=Chryseobacterium sp. PET-29 TaxID=2983267 RepID=UPI0021E54A9E|nr:DNA repair protein Rad50 [Chryseobacterium sp. PET-29]